MAKKPNFVSSSIRERSASKAPDKPVTFTAAQKKAMAAYLASTGIGTSNPGVPKYLRKPTAKSGSVSSGMVGMGKNSPLTKTSLATNPKRALDSREWEMGVEGATGISRNNSAAMNAGLAAMAFLPVPGLRNIGKVAAGAGKVASTGAKAAATGAKAAGKGAKPATNTGKVADFSTMFPNATGPKLPGSIGGKGASSATEAANLTRQNFLNAGYSKEIAEAAAKRNGAQYERGMVRTSETPIDPAPKVAAAANRRTASEAATIRKGKQNAKTPEVSAKLDAADAKATASSPAKFGRDADIEFRTPQAGDPSMATKAQISKFQTARGKAQGGTRRTAEQRDMYKDDLQKTLGIGARMRAEGRTPGLDVGGRGNAAPTLGSKPPVSTPKPTPKEAIRETAAAGLRKPIKPRNPGRAGSEAKQQRYKEGMAKYEKDLSAWEKRTAGMASKTKAIDEGRLKPDGTPKGATAKSMARNQRNLAKKAGAEGPKKPASAAKPAPAKATAGAEGPKKPATAAENLGKFPKKPTKAQMAEGSRKQIEWWENVELPGKAPGGNSTFVKGSKATKPSSEVVRVPTTRGQKAGGPQVKGGRVIPLAPKRGKEIEVIRGKVLATRPSAAPARPVKRGGLLKKGLGGMAGVGAVAGAAGYTFQKSDAGKTKPSTADQGSEGMKRQVLRDKYGRQIGRTEYNKREKFRASILGKSPEQVAKMRKAEAKRREEFRNTEGKRMFGALASKKTKNSGVPVGVSVRKKNQFRATPRQIAERERFK